MKIKFKNKNYKNMKKYKLKFIVGDKEIKLESINTVSSGKLPTKDECKYEEPRCYFALNTNVPHEFDKNKIKRVIDKNFLNGMFILAEDNDELVFIYNKESNQEEIESVLDMYQFAIQYYNNLIKNNETAKQNRAGY